MGRTNCTARDSFALLFGYGKLERMEERVMHRTYGIAISVTVMLVLFATWAIVLLTMGDRFEWLRLFILVVMVIVGNRLVIKEEVVTASGAIVMAFGIFVNGALHQFPVLNQTIGKDLTVFLFLVWLFITVSFIQSLRQRTFKKRHWDHPIASFALGTWIAGTSVMGVAMYQRLPEFHIVIYVFAAANVVLWVLFIQHCIRNLIKIMVNRKLRNNVHGVLLLATVSTQSIIVLFSAIFEHPILSIFSQGMIALGIVLYAIGFVLIVNRYMHFSEWNIADDWQNTNCIIHGAMSITGLASAVSGVVPANWTLLIWVWVLLWFIIVEMIELARATVRMKLYGVTKGIGTYHVSQWSRNFTFGMLYAFTLNFDLSHTILSDNSVARAIHTAILAYGGWIVLALLLNEWLLHVKANLQDRLSERKTKTLFVRTSK